MITFLKLNIIFFFDVLARKVTISRWITRTSCAFVLFKNGLYLPVQVNKIWRRYMSFWMWCCAVGKIAADILKVCGVFICTVKQSKKATYTATILKMPRTTHRRAQSHIPQYFLLQHHHLAKTVLQNEQICTFCCVPFTHHVSHSGAWFLKCVQNFLKLVLQHTQMTAWQHADVNPVLTSLKNTVQWKS